MTRTNYFRDLMPTVAPEADDRAWWEACRRHELTVPTCSLCGLSRFPISPVCPQCFRPGMALKKVSGRGKIFSYTVQHNPPTPALAAICPYNIAIIELDDTERTHMVSNIVDATPDELAIGLPVEVVWEELQGNITVPRFRVTGF
ncbi:Zn-ribbon domain-containing OB-fold protein [Massilia cavernae]|uniref:Thiolase n=1 Tax=Massilia cavernae TaxID=2320864 RepID=A0A418Y0T0_9BURK|nr:OB-fold domain-containing protein [Massilia cavernae]RJG18856.1 thiolase [Massilia cavernae]